MALLMIPGPIEISDAVREAAAGPPPGHLAADFMEAFGASLEKMREVWCASSDAQPFIVAGSGTMAMEMAVSNLLAPGDSAVVASSGYFSHRIAEMIRRRGVDVTIVDSEPGEAPDHEAVEAALREARPKALFATHVDTSTGVRVDAEALARLARAHGALSVFDGVCATAAERFEMERWGADVYLTASQKAIGLPAGLALMVVSPRALAAREGLSSPPPMSMDFAEWIPIMRAYEERRPSYFSTPATTLVRALPVGLDEILTEGMEARFALHERAARAFRAAWASLGLTLLPASEEITANTLSAIRYPEGVDASLVGAIKARGVVVAGGLHPKIKAEYFRVGHMGAVLSDREALHRTVRAVGEALVEKGHACDVDAAIGAFDDVFV